MSAAAILAQAEIILGAEANWTQKAIARKADGTPCGPLSEFATRWDLYGAMVKAKTDLALPQSDLNEAALILQSGFVTRNTDVDYFNDNNTYAACLAILSP